MEGERRICPITRCYLYDGDASCLYVLKASPYVGKRPRIVYHIQITKSKPKRIKVGEVQSPGLSEDGTEEKHGSQEAEMNVMGGCCVRVRGRGVQAGVG